MRDTAALTETTEREASGTRASPSTHTHTHTHTAPHRSRARAPRFRLTMIRFPFQEALAPLCGLVWLSNPSRRARAGRRTRAPTSASHHLDVSHTRTLHARIPPPLPVQLSRACASQRGLVSLGSPSPFSLDNFSFIASSITPLTQSLHFGQSYCAFNHSADTITAFWYSHYILFIYSRTNLHLSDL